MSDTKELLKPVWLGGTQYRETFMMIQKNGVCEAPFYISRMKY